MQQPIFTTKWGWKFLSIPAQTSLLCKEILCGQTIAIAAKFVERKRCYPQEEWHNGSWWALQTHYTIRNDAARTMKDNLILTNFDFKLFFCLTFQITFVCGQNIDKISATKIKDIVSCFQLNWSFDLNYTLCSEFIQGRQTKKPGH